MELRFITVFTNFSGIYPLSHKQTHLVRNFRDILKPLGPISPRKLQNVTEVQNKILNTGHIKKKKNHRGLLRSGCNTRDGFVTFTNRERKEELEKRFSEVTRESQSKSFTLIYIDVLSCSLSIGLYFCLPRSVQTEINFLLYKVLNIQLAALMSFTVTKIKRSSGK